MLAPRGVGLAGQLLDRGAAERRRHALDKTGECLCLAGGEQLCPMLREQDSDLAIGVGLGERAQGILDLSVRLEPIRGAAEQSACLFGIPGPGAKREVANERVQRVVLVLPLQEEPAPAEAGERGRRVVHTESFAKVRRETIEQRGGAQELQDFRRFLREDLSRQVGEHRIASSADLLQRLGARRRGPSGERRDCEPDERRPASGQLVQRSCELGVPGPELCVQQCFDLCRGEGKVRAGELQHLSPAAKAIDRERRFGS